MVDLQARKNAADRLQQFYQCETTNDQFVESWDAIQSDDIALEEIYQVVWDYYDVLQTHKLEGRHSLDSISKGLFERCILFLRSDIEYPWPKNTRFTLPSDLYRMKRRIFWATLAVLLLLYVLISIKYYFFIVIGLFLIPIFLFLIDGSMTKYRKKSGKEIIFYDYQKGMEYWPFRDELEYNSMLKKP